jgi:hypothetical protein
MRIWIVFLLASLVYTWEVNACCGAGQYRIFPLGMIKNKAVCAVFEMGRYCEEEFYDYSWGGKLYLALQSGDSLEILSEVAPTIEFQECICTPNELEQKSEYMNYMSAFMDSALIHAKKLKGFEPFERMEYIASEPEFVKNKVRLINDQLEVRNFSRFCKIEAMNCEALSMVREVRFYYLKNKCVAVCSMGCPEGRMLTDQMLETGRSNALKSSIGMTYLPVDWHGYTKDLLLGPN